MSLRTRVSKATQALLGREERSAGVQILYGDRVKPPFRPTESLKAYGDNPYLYSAVNAVAHEISRTKFQLVKPKDDENVPVVNHQALTTLQHPQPTSAGKTVLTRMQLFCLLGQYLMLNGEAFWLLDKRAKMGGAPTFIRPLLPSTVDMRMNTDGTIAYYTHRTSAGEITIRPEDMVHFKLPNPEDYHRGHSPVQSIRYSLETHKEADKLNYHRFGNDAIPAMVLETDKPVADIDRRKILGQWNETFGGSSNSGKTAMLPSGLKATKIQESNHDMQFVEGKHVNRDEILANFRIGLEMLGHTESQTRANAEAAIFIFSRFGVLPMVEMITDTLNHDYLPVFPGTDGMEFIFEDPVQENVEERRATAQVLFQQGALTPNEMRQQFGLQPLNLPEMDMPYIGMSSVPIGVPLT
jgi:HK97 family phage portal protein